MELNIKTLILEKRVETLMQLVVSPNKEFVSGVEALSRGIHPETGELISPVLLFAMAREVDMLYELEELMFYKAFETFKPLYEAQNELLLFINMSPEFIERCLNVPMIEEAIVHFGIPASNIFFDINPFKFNQLDMIKAFIDTYKRKGFYVCVDDVGLDYSNIDKILYLGPDVLKINIRALKQLTNQRYAEKMIQTLKFITEPMGIVMVSKGIEDEADLMFSLESGSQFMQGYFISKPLDLTPESLVTIKLRYAKLIEAHVEEESGNIQLSRQLTAKACKLINSVVLDLDPGNQPLHKANIDQLFIQYPMIESLWLLDAKGRQMGQTWVNKERYEIKHTSLFQLHNDGSDFTAKDLYLQLYNTILDIWVTPPFKSTMTNNLCISCSKRLDNAVMGAVICLDINIDACSEDIKESTKKDEDQDDFQIIIQPMAD